MILLGVNIDHVATLRQARGTRYPDPVQAAIEAEQAGADGITVHLREDRRHIQERDIDLLRQTVETRINLEMAPTDEMLIFAESRRQKIAGQARERSYAHVSNTHRQIMDVSPAAVEQAMLQHRVNLLIHGHTHQPNIHTLTLNNQGAHRIVLDAWHDHGNMLVYDDTHHFELINFT